MNQSNRFIRWAAVLLALTLLAAACGDDDDTAESEPAAGDNAVVDEPDTAPEPETADATDGDSQEPSAADAAADDGADDAAPAGETATLRVAFFAAGSQNGYNQAIWRGVQAAAEADGNVETEIFDGEFNPELQFNQVQDIVASGRFDGYVIAPNDPVGIVPVIEEALADGPVGTALFPIGPNLETLEPQLEGMITAAGLVTESAAAGAEAVVTYCEALDPCRVIIIMGFLTAPFDNLRLETFEEILNQHGNIEILAVGEGLYSQDASLTTMQDLLQSNPEFDVLLSNADQHVTGALIAIEDAGIDIEPLWISGGGASEEAIAGIQAGTWDASLANFPFTEGFGAAANVIASLRGEPVQQVIDVNVENDLGVALVTAEVLAANPDWEAEWAG